MKKIFLILILLGTVFPETMIVSAVNDQLLQYGVSDFETDYYKQQQDMELPSGLTFLWTVNLVRRNNSELLEILPEGR